MWIVVGMNRLRRAYLDLAPNLEAHFITSAHDDVAGFLQSYGGYGRPVRLGASPGAIVSSTGAIVGILDCVLFAIVVALFVNLAGAGSTIYIVAGVIAGLAAAVIVVGIVPYRQIAHITRYHQPRFPRHADTTEPDPAPDPES